MNVEKIWSLVPEEVRTSYAKSTDVPVIDCEKLGIFKVLGKGNLPKQAVIVRARYFTDLAEKKIKQVGGICELVE